VEKFSGLFSQLPDTIPLNDAASVFDLLVEYKKETEVSRRDLAKIQAMKEIVVTEITRKYDFYEKLFAAVFAERSAVTQKFFKIIDKGIKENNTDLVLAGLSNLSDVVASSPLADIKILPFS
jgi:hypothetical protein